MSQLIDYIILLGLTFLLMLTPYPHGSVSLRHQLLIIVTILSLAFLKLLFSSNLRQPLEKTSDIGPRTSHLLSFIRGNSEEISLYSYIEKPLFLLIAISFLSIFYSLYHYASVLSFLQFISYVALFYLVLNTINSKKRFYFFLWLIFLTVSFYALYGILQYRGFIDKTYWAEPSSLSSRFINSNHFVDYLAMSTLLMLAFLFSKGRLWLKLLTLPLLGINSLAIVYTRSRFGWLSLLLAFTIFIILFFKYVKPSKKKFILTILILVIGCWLLVTTFGRGVILKRIGEISSTGYQSLIQRLQIWYGTFRAIMHYPWGTGLGSFKYVYAQFRIHSDRFIVDYAHNDYLQISLELGILGLISILWLVIRYLKFIIFHLKSVSNNKNLAIDLGLLSAIIAMLFHSGVDYGLFIPANMILFIFILAILTAQGGPRQIRRLPKKMVISLLFSAAAFIFIAVQIYLSQSASYKGDNYSKEFKLDKAILSYNRAIKHFPLNAVYYEKLGKVYARRGAIKAGMNQWDRLALLNFKKSLRLNPRNSELHLNLARIYKKLGMKELSMRELKDAARFYPTDGAYHLFLADYLLESELVEEAITEYRKYFSLFTVEERYRYPSRIFSACFKVTQDYSKLKNLIPQADAGLHLKFGFFLAAKADWEGAGSEFAKVKDLSYNKINFRLAIASTYERYKKTDNAVAEYREILKIAPENKPAKSALERIGHSGTATFY